MANKKYYWLKLKEDFFRDKRIKKLRKIAGGDTYTIIYFKMQLLSLKNNGALIYEGVEPTFEEEIALEIDEDIDNVKITIAFLQANGMVEETDQDHYILPETIKCIGSESASTERVRRMRAKKKLLGEPQIDEKRYGGNGLKALERDNYKCVICGSAENICIHHNNGLSNELEDLVTLCRKCHAKIEAKDKSVTCNAQVTNSNIEIDIEKEKEIEQEIDIEIIPEERKATTTKTKRFVKPTIEEIKAYCLERNNNVDAEHFYDYYEANGWKVGKNPMKDWKASVRTWERNSYKDKAPQQQSGGIMEDYRKLEEKIQNGGLFG